VAGVSGKGSMMKAPVSKTVFPAKKASAGSKPADGATAGMPSAAGIPTKAQKNPNGNTPLGPNGTNKHSAIAKGPGKKGVSKK
jgi:hypothetical protein